MNAVVTRRTKVLGFMVVAETVRIRHKNISRYRRWGKWTRSKQENWLVFWVCDENVRGGFPAAKHVQYDRY